MIRAPSEKTLIACLGITRAQARKVRGLIKGTIDPESVEGTAAWVRQCFNRPDRASLVMHAIDTTIEAHGVEALGPTIDRRFTPAFEYCNTGDTYAATIIRDNRRGIYFVSSWGDLVESDPQLNRG